MQSCAYVIHKTCEKKFTTTKFNNNNNSNIINMFKLHSGPTKTSAHMVDAGVYETMKRNNNTHENQLV